MSQPSVVEYAVDRLSKLGITECFGIPGALRLAAPHGRAARGRRAGGWG